MLIKEQIYLHWAFPVSVLLLLLPFQMVRWEAMNSRFPIRRCTVSPSPTVKDLWKVYPPLLRGDHWWQEPHRKGPNLTVHRETGGWLPSELCSDAKNHLATSWLSPAPRQPLCSVTATIAPLEIILMALCFSGHSGASLKNSKLPSAIHYSRQSCVALQQDGPTKANLFSRTYEYTEKFISEALK